MTKRFMFSHEATDYEALGNYGQGEKFTITKFPLGTTRMMRNHGTPSGVDVVALVSDVGTQDELLAGLNKTFPGLTSFRSF